jgi:hypothetical protein
MTDLGEMSDREIGRWIIGGIAVLLLLGTLSIRACWRYSVQRELAACWRYSVQRELACNRAGGVLLSPPQGASHTSNHEMCAKITSFTFEQVPIQ